MDGIISCLLVKAGFFRVPYWFIRQREGTLARFVPAGMVFATYGGLHACEVATSEESLMKRMQKLLESQDSIPNRLPLHYVAIIDRHHNGSFFELMFCY